MAEEDHDAARARDAERLRALETRLGEKAGEKPPSRGEEHFSQANMAWRMVIELVAGLAIGFGIGYGLDYLTGLQPLFMVVFVLLGLAAGIKTMMRTAKEIGEAPGRPGDDKGE
ncbi:AtpZ/AtpI family protein [Paracoccus methylovorus]|uniref:ATP synthase protein I n=1 Tax=Paracoccus methylovorus TaxID=2812658 RepID=A0ABX7JQQ2_9RHOB|nr:MULTISPECIES: AtpZ/AtpI family protein [Paracoccus]QRZ15324.1 AtpZ/AtpI family protein [Paracoccus methylovorus]